jgi:hypothetical protein
MNIDLSCIVKDLCALRGHLDTWSNGEGSYDRLLKIYHYDADKIRCYMVMVVCEAAMSI